MKKRTISAEKSKQAILRAALEEFSRRGISGARTEAIAKAAGVNIALVFYYFKNKEQLYLTVLEDIFAEMNRRVTAALDCCENDRERILAYLQTHFDYLAESPLRPRLIMQEYARGTVVFDKSQLVASRASVRYFRSLSTSFALRLHSARM